MEVDANKVIEELTKQNAIQNLELIKYKVAFQELQEKYNELKEVKDAKDNK